MTPAVHLFENFINLINSHRSDRILDIMSDDHVFIDAQNNRVVGRKQLEKAWFGYFELFPDYQIELSQVFEKEDQVAGFGFASASYRGEADRYWRVPAAWVATIAGGKIASWQVIADTKTPYDSITRPEKL